MANVNRPNGFKVVGTLSGAPWTSSIRKFYSGTDNLFMGDIVEKGATGVASGDGAYPEVHRAEADDIPVGVVVGWEVNPSALDRLYHAASSTYAVYVCVDPNVLLEAQVDTAGLAVTDVGLNIDFVVAAGSTTSGVSNMQLDGGTEATTADEPLKLMGAVNRMDNEPALAYSRWIVMFNQHAYRSDAGTAGI